VPDNSSILEHARHYAARGWPIFRLNGYKTPLKDTRGHLDATTDPAVIEQWWGGWKGRRLNIGLVCGVPVPAAPGGLVVLDCDGAGGLVQLRTMAETHGAIERTLPVTLTAKSARGWHLYYARPLDAPPLAVLNGKRGHKGDDGLDIKAAGSYVVLPPSINAKNGFQYAWINPVETIATLPAWLVEHIATRGGREAPRTSLDHAPQAAGTSADLGLSDRPAWMADGPTLNAGATRLARAIELPSFLAALKKLDAGMPEEQWWEIGAGIHDFDPGADGLVIFKRWSRESPRHQADEHQAACEKEWYNYKKNKPGKRLITKATIYHRAKQIPDPIPEEPAPSVGLFNGTANGAHALPHTISAAPIKTQIRWIDTDEEGNPRPTCANAALAVSGLNVWCCKDLFHEKLFVGGHAIDKWAGDLGDDAVLMLRRLIKRHYWFDPGEKNTRDAAVQLCLENSFNPVVDYLARLTWDGRERIGRWVVTYLGVPETPLTCAIGRLMLVAAVRRARRPGVKFDQIIVLEGPEGTGKSSALRILAGDDNFSDQAVLGVSDKEQQEAIMGVWIHEIAELAGMRRTEVERIKAFASRTEDRARPAYGRFRVDMRRRGIFVATTNADAYLKSDTGDRRFWPLATTTIDLEGIKRDRDQLWAEAATCEARGDSLVLDRKLWSEAREAQRARQEVDPWYDTIRAHITTKNVEDTSITEILEGIMRMQTREYGQIEQNRAARVMQHLGFERYRKRDGDSLSWRYRPRGAGTGGTVGT
jgi:hypothetical protein